MPFYKKTWFVWLMMIMCFPIGLILIWTQSSYSKKTKGIITAVCLLLIAISMGSSGNKNQTQKPKEVAEQQSQAKQEEKSTVKTEQPKQETKPVEAPKPQPTPTLHVNPTDFQIRFNNYMHNYSGELGATGMFDIGEPSIQKGNGQDVVQYVNNDLNLIIMELIDPVTGEIKEVSVTSTVAGKDGQTIQASLLSAIMVYVATIKSVDPSADAAEIQEKLGMTQSVDKWVTDTETSSNGVRYFKKVIKGVGLGFGATAIN